jgi:hypothetical protein
MDVASGWTWSKMTHRKKMHHGSISMDDFFVNYFVDGSVDLWIEAATMFLDMVKEW